MAQEKQPWLSSAHHVIRLQLKFVRWSWVEHNHKMPNQTICSRSLNDFSSSICLSVRDSGRRETARLWKTFFFFFAASLICPGSICCTPVIHLHLPLRPAPLFKECSSRNVLFSVMYNSGKSACMPDVEFDYVWHCNLNNLGLNKIRFVKPCVPQYYV